MVWILNIISVSVYAVIYFFFFLIAEIIVLKSSDFEVKPSGSTGFES